MWTAFYNRLSYILRATSARKESYFYILNKILVVAISFIISSSFFFKLDISLRVIISISKFGSCGDFHCCDLFASLSSSLWWFSFRKLVDVFQLLLLIESFVMGSQWDIAHHRGQKSNYPKIFFWNSVSNWMDSRRNKNSKTLVPTIVGLNHFLLYPFRTFWNNFYPDKLLFF